MTGTFGGVQFVPHDRPAHEGGSASWRLDDIDLSAPRSLKDYDKTGSDILLRDVRPILFPGVKRLTKQRAESFFDDTSNFEDP